MLLTDLLSSDAYTPVNKAIAKSLGFVTAGYFGELIRQRKRFYDQTGSEEFYFSQSQMTEEIGISEHEQRASLKILIEAGFVIAEKKGLPSRYHFVICDELVLEYMKHQSSKIGSTGDQKFEAHIISKKEIIKNKEINIPIENALKIIDPKQELLLEFYKSRTKLRKPMTDKAKELFIKKLEQYPEHEQIQMLEEAIEKGWQTIYPKKKNDISKNGKDLDRMQRMASYNIT